MNNMEILEERFREWIDDRITDCMSCPPMSEEHRWQLRRTEDAYYNARDNLTRIAKEIREGK